MRQHHDSLAAAVFLAPALVAVVVLRLWPACEALHASLLAPRAINFSLDNYRYIFTDRTFLNSLEVTLLYSVVVNPLQIALALMLALLLARELPLVGLWRTLILLPVAIPQSVSAVIWGVAFRPDGPLNAALALFGIGAQRFTTSPGQALASIIVVVSWIGIGYWMTFLIAGLQEIPPSLYEAAAMDGANRWQRLRHITIPQLRRPLTFVLVANTVANLLVFAPVQILTKGGPDGATDLIMNEIYTRAFVTGDTSSAAAASVVLVVVTLVVVAVQFRLMTPREQ